MRFIFEENQDLSLLKSKYAKAVAELIGLCDSARTHKLVPAATDLNSLAVDAGFYVLREGLLSLALDKRELFYFEEGDVIFVDNEIRAQFQIQSDFATRVDFYRASEVTVSALTYEALARCSAMQQVLLAQAVAQLFKGEKKTQPVIRSVKAGEVIVSEGEISDRVFTLLEGHAQVSAAGQIVGEVNVDELLGVIGALCDMPRIATVTATKDSLLMSLAKDEFIYLLSLRPHTVVKLIKDFARVIASSNQELLALKKGA